MEATTVLSLSWRAGGPELLSRCTVPHEKRPEVLGQLAVALKAEELVYIGTCNRVELAYRSTHKLSVDSVRSILIQALDPNGQTAKNAWKVWRGEGAIEHLLLVACGLASANIGETEISGQLRDSLQLSRALSLGGGPLDQFIEEALRCAKRVRRETSIAEGRTSLAEIALERLAAHRGTLKEPYRIALLGRSAMTERVARSLRGSGVVISWVNRHPERLAKLAEEYGATIHSLKSYQAEPAEADALICATGSTTPLLNVAALRKVKDAGTSLIIDLSVSPDVTAADALECGVEHLGLDEILKLADKTRSGKELAAADARVLIDQALEQLTMRSRARDADRAASRLHEQFRAAASTTAKDALMRELKHLGVEDAERIRRFADLLARKLAHDPAKGLKRLAASHGREAAERFLDGDVGEVS